MSKLHELSEHGVSIWLDDLSRARLTSGNLAELIRDHAVVGVTTNPAIFQAAISDADDYRDDIRRLAQEGLDAEAIITELTTSDVRQACDLFAQTYEQTDGVDGRVSIEVDPRLAHNGPQTVEQAMELYERVDRKNVMIKIPATTEGLSAIRETIAAGISVNVTLIFSIERYREVLEAYLEGLELAARAGRDLSQIHSVASFFISRVDTAVDARLEEIGGPSALAMRGKAAIASARTAYEVFRDVESSDRFQTLANQGARLQRLLWASTGVKNPAYSPTMYVDQLVTSAVVNTMPEATLWAVKDHADLHAGDTVQPAIEQAHNTLHQLTLLGVDLPGTCHRLEDEGVEKFEVAWEDLIQTVHDEMR
ncbi:transaldolase [Trueperella sp. LYQ143]|uniref:transaldolase n=1 Tax=unclassified Trueperella TaxID=2630174 RepID=UPI0039836F7D